MNLADQQAQEHARQAARAVLNAAQGDTQLAELAIMCVRNPPRYVRWRVSDARHFVLVILMCRELVAFLLAQTAQRQAQLEQQQQLQQKAASWPQLGPDGGQTLGAPKG